MTESPATIHAFWFGTDADDARTAAARSRLWWSKNETLDRAMAERFAGCVEAAASGTLDAWAAQPRGLLALILLTDQFPRNIYRGMPQSFACDGLARNWCRQGLAEGADRLLRPIERVFFYLPLEHSEALADQEQAVMLFERLLTDAPQEQSGLFDGFLDFARRHHEIIRRFGRFPHRNAILGRASTPEETQFLRQKGSSF